MICFALSQRLMEAMQFSIFKWRAVNWKRVFISDLKIENHLKNAVWRDAFLYTAVAKVTALEKLEMESVVEWGMGMQVETLQRFNPTLTVASNALRFRQLQFLGIQRRTLEFREISGFLLLSCLVPACIGGCGDCHHWHQGTNQDHHHHHPLKMKDGMDNYKKHGLPNDEAALESWLNEAHSQLQLDQFQQIIFIAICL